MRKLSLAPRGKGVNAARLGFALRGAGRLEALFGSPESNDGFGSMNEPARAGGSNYQGQCVLTE